MAPRLGWAVAAVLLVLAWPLSPLPLGSVVTAAAAPAAPLTVTSTAGVHQLAANLSASLSVFADGILSTNAIQAQHAAASESGLLVDGPTARDQAVAVVGAFMSRRRSQLNALADTIQRQFAAHASPAAPVLQLDFPEATNPSSLPTLGTAVDFVRPINDTQSMVFVPVTVSQHDPVVLNNINQSRLLDAVFRSHAESDLADGFPRDFQYFAFADGTMRIFPTTQWIPDNKLPFDPYNPISTRWFLGATSATKNMVILIDASGTNEGLSLSMAKVGTSLLLDTLTSNDFVTVIYFNDKARYTIASSPRLIQATPEAIEDLKNSLDGISVEESANFDIAYELAFDTLEAARTGGPSAKLCQEVIVLFSDGALGSDNAEYVLNQRNSDRHTRIFTFRLGDGTSAGFAGLRDMACNNRGVLRTPRRLEVLVDDIMRFTSSYLSEDLGGDPESLVSFSTSFVQPRFSDDLKIVLSQPVFYNDSSTGERKLAGVAAVDMRFETFLKVVQDALQGRASALSNIIVVDNNGATISHPRLAPNSLSVAITKLEPAMATFLGDMLAGNTGSMVTETDFQVNSNSAHPPVRMAVAFYYAPIADFPYRLCYMVPRAGQPTPVTWHTGAVQESYYDRLDIYNSPLTASVMSGSGIAVGPGSPVETEPDGSTIKISTVRVDSGLLCPPTVPLVADLRSDNALSLASSLVSIHNAMQDPPGTFPASGNIPACAVSEVMKARARAGVQLTALVDTLWPSAWPAMQNASVYESYLGTAPGVLRTFPGRMRPRAEFILQQQEWYTRAITEREARYITAPYFDWRNNTVISLGVKIYSNATAVTPPEFAGGSLTQQPQIPTTVFGLSVAPSHVAGLLGGVVGGASNSSSRVYLVSTQGMVIASNQNISVGAYFGTVEGEAARALMAGGLLVPESFLRPSTTCDAENPNSASASVLFQSLVRNALRSLVAATQLAVTLVSLLGSMWFAAPASAQLTQSTVPQVPCATIAQGFRILSNMSYPTDAALADPECGVGTVFIDALPEYEAFVVAVTGGLSLCAQMPAGTPQEVRTSDLFSDADVAARMPLPCTATVQGQPVACAAAMQLPPAAGALLVLLLLLALALG